MLVFVLFLSTCIRSKWSRPFLGLPDLEWRRNTASTVSSELTSVLCALYLQSHTRCTSIWPESNARSPKLQKLSPIDPRNGTSLTQIKSIRLHLPPNQV